MWNYRRTALEGSREKRMRNVLKLRAVTEVDISKEKKKEANKQIKDKITMCLSFSTPT